VTREELVQTCSGTRGCRANEPALFALFLSAQHAVLRPFFGVYAPRKRGGANGSVWGPSLKEKTWATHGAGPRVWEPPRHGRKKPAFFREIVACCRGAEGRGSPSRARRKKAVALPYLLLNGKCATSLLGAVLGRRHAVGRGRRAGSLGRARPRDRLGRGSGARRCSSVNQQKFIPRKYKSKEATERPALYFSSHEAGATERC
jgi:hypothetical protein